MRSKQFFPKLMIITAFMSSLAFFAGCTDSLNTSNCDGYTGEVTNKSTIAFLSLFICSAVFAAPNPPAPIPPPVGLPIDNNIIFLALFFILYSFYILRKKQVK